MRRPGCIEVRAYRGCRLEVIDDGGLGWGITVRLPGDAPVTRLQTDRPNGLAGLIETAKRLVDEQLLAAAGQPPG